jgi:hypothetical protein
MVTPLHRGPRCEDEDCAPVNLMASKFATGAITILLPKK